MRSHPSFPRTLLGPVAIQVRVRESFDVGGFLTRRTITSGFMNRLKPKPASNARGSLIAIIVVRARAWTFLVSVGVGAVVGPFGVGYR